MASTPRSPRRFVPFPIPDLIRHVIPTEIAAESVPAALRRPPAPLGT